MSYLARLHRPRIEYPKGITLAVKVSALFELFARQGAAMRLSPRIIPFARDALPTATCKPEHSQ